MFDSQDVLDGAYLILRDRGISREAYARDEHDFPCPTYSAQATSFCGTGAIARACWELGEDTHSWQYKEAVHTLKRAMIHIGEQAIYANWNDYVATDQDILMLFQAMATPGIDSEQYA